MNGFIALFGLGIFQQQLHRLGNNDLTPAPLRKRKGFYTIPEND